MHSGLTWYDVLGVLPGAEARKINRAYDAKAALLRPELIWGAPPDVLTAATRAQALLDAAREVLGDPASRNRYDEAAGLRRSGGGLGQPGSGIESAGTASAGLPALTGWLGPRRRRSRPAAVPDVRGLFYHVCREVATRHGLHVRIIRLTERPMAVDGLVVDQDPRPPAKQRRRRELTVQLWHPPAQPRLRVRAVHTTGGEPIDRDPDRSPRHSQPRWIDRRGGGLPGVSRPAWSERYRDLGRSRNQVVCRLHAVLRAGRWRCRQAHHRRPGRTDPRIAHAAGRGCGSPLRARRRVPRGPARH